MNTAPKLHATLLTAALAALIGCSDSTTPSAHAGSPSSDRSTGSQDTPAAPEIANTQKTPEFVRNPEVLAKRKEIQTVSAASAMFTLGIAPTVTKIVNHEIPLEHQQIIYELLADTNEVAIHQMRGEHENRVMLHRDGREAVYGKDGKLLTNGYNDGSYNYADPADEPLLHFILDISPWIQLGLSEIDPTDANERIYAYMGDLEGGINRASKRAPFDPLTTDHQWTETGQIQAVAIFVRAIELGGAEELYSLVLAGKEISDEEIIRVLTKLNAGFELVYAK